MAEQFVITTSWDDGHPLDMRIAEMLTRFGLSGTFYVPIRSEWGVMSRDEIRELSNSFEVGAHTINHIYLTTASEEMAKVEIAGSKQALEEICARECRVFCFPGGAYNDEHLKMVRDAGFSAVRTVEMMSVAAPRRRCGLAVIPTTLQLYPHRASSYLRNVAKRLHLGNVVPLIYALRTQDLVERTRMLLEHASGTGGVFHLWGHSWEIEAERQWHTLEAILRLISSFKSSATCVANGALVTHAQ